MPDHPPRPETGTPDPYAHVFRRMLEGQSDRITEDDRRAGDFGLGNIDRDEVVVPPAREEYRHPRFLERTASPDEIAEFDELLARLWSENACHAGENTLEVQALYAATGAADELDEGFRLWFDRYLRRRADLGRLNPQVLNDPCLLRRSVMREVWQLVEHLATKAGTLNSVFLNNSIGYAKWLTLVRLVGPFVTGADGRWTESYDPADRAVARTTLEEYADVMSYAGLFRRTIGRLSAVALPGSVPAGDADLRIRLAGLAIEIQQMRPFVGGLRRAKTAVVQLGDGPWVCWSYTVWHGGVFGYIIAADTELGATRAHHARAGAYVAGVNGRGVLCSHEYPWEGIEDVASTADPRPLAVNYVVLDAIHSKLFETYDKNDLDRLRWRPDEAAGPPADLDAAIECSVIDLARRQPTPDEADGPTDEPCSIGLISSLRFSRLCRLLEGRLGCEVRGGKGSEVVAFRAGGRIDRFGKHKADFVVPPGRIRLMLRRLNILPSEWLDAVYGRGQTRPAK
jgi:hypothetical protein